MGTTSFWTLPPPLPSCHEYGVLSGHSRSGLLDSRQTFINFIFINKLVGTGKKFGKRNGFY